MVRVSIVSNNPLRVRDIANLLAEEDRIGIVDAPDVADVVIAAGVSAEDLPPHAAVIFLGNDLSICRKVRDARGFQRRCRLGS